MNLLDLWDYIVPCVMIFYGFRWLTNPPEFNSRNGLATKYARMSEENWLTAHLFGGKLCIAYGIVMLAIAIIKRFIKAEPLFTISSFVVIGINLVLIFSIIPLVNMYVKSKTR